MRVKDLMKTPVATVDPEDTLHVADGIMTLGALRHLPVVKEGRLVGILTQRDVLRTPSELYDVAADARGVLKALRVREAMTKDVVTVDVDATDEEAADRLLDHRVDCLPVVERGVLVGIVTASDLLRVIGRPHDEPDHVTLGSAHGRLQGTPQG